VGMGEVQGWCNRTMCSTARGKQTEDSPKMYAGSYCLVMSLHLVIESSAVLETNLGPQAPAELPHLKNANAVLLSLALETLLAAALCKMTIVKGDSMKSRDLHQPWSQGCYSGVSYTNPGVGIKTTILRTEPGFDGT
jgi:hypothetical protein